MNSLPAAVRIVEVGPRDGFQSIEQTIPTDAKIQFINTLSEAKLPEIEVTSFVSAKWIPQLADAQEVSTEIIRDSNILYTALIPNIKGLERALDANYSSVAVFTAASDTFSQKNINCSIKESITRFQKMKTSFQDNNMRVRGYISTVWVCPYEGQMEPENVLPVIDALLELGIDEISLGDTIGKATPDDVRNTLDLILSLHDANQFALHFHDTYNHALENIRVGLEYGISTFDSSAGGVGGCPFAPGASGNVSTGSVLNLCKELGIETGVDDQKLSAAVNFIQSYLN
ncbi:MAG TPA: hydroxymethylglutaryl-CoA lyase [Candidatus Marinimicrobia bacterium]|jgi:hydroxymethylglutaryl-CoA lyase|nr:hydroxymethylglutaryl-CoA lyase [Candidatus Neomarinimicrobiota bacterium]HIB60338.1 hydroxymethylglutaryl-CoA lyase [Candidatus Neomarinimicrobiota bacterium]